MKKQLIFLAILLIALFFNELSAQWVVYDCSTLPENTTSDGVLWEENDNTEGITENGVSDLFSLVDDPDIGGNKLIKIEEFEGLGKESFSNDWAIEDPNTGLTFVFRAKASDGMLGLETSDTNTYRIAYVSPRNGSFREEFSIEYPDTLDLKYAGDRIRIHFPTAADWHIYRLTMQGDLVKLYVDENPTPIAEGITAKTTSNNFIKIGKTTTENSIYGGLFDWIIWDKSGAYAPGEGTPLPSTLTGLPTSDNDWIVYDCSTLPENTTCDSVLWVENDNTEGITENGVSDLFSLVDDPDIGGNKLIKIEEFEGLSKESFSNDWGIEDPNTGLTFVFRTKASDGMLGLETSDENTYRIAYVSPRNGSFREEFSIEYPDTLDLKYAGDRIRIHFPTAADWHIYRLTMQGDLVKLYVDENPTPIAEGITAKTTSNNFIKIGKTTTENSMYGGLFDWVIWNKSGAYAPGEGTPLPSTLTGLLTSVKELNDDIPNNFELSQNYPNPFNPSTIINFSLVEKSNITLKIYDVRGSLVETLVDKEMNAGSYSVTWNASNFAAGVYFYKLTAGGKLAVNKMILIK